MPKSSFQEIILKLQDFWASHGCLITQPYYTQVGAGTMNPSTFLRVLGPEPWNVAYVEPSVRPDDGRYGENPNRFQKHTQFQVILKPDPGNPQELYLESLKSLGIDPRQHDIRFVEDNWEQPAIAAWGLGWEVWLDGQEITQFTYFQQMGGVTLNPVSVEITYGLERILIALNNAKAIWDEEWGAGVTYGEITRREEFEHSKYYYEVADVQRARQMYDLFSAEADACLAQGLLVPAHDYVLKSSHTFNILDARGAISVAERQAFFRRMRELARRVAEGYEVQRKELEYPLLKEDQSSKGKTKFTSVPSLSNPRPEHFLLEIGVEELPAGDVDVAQDQLSKRVPSLLAELRLGHGDIRVFATPRRIVVSSATLPRSSPTARISSRDRLRIRHSIKMALPCRPRWALPKRMAWIPGIWKSVKTRKRAENTFTRSSSRRDAQHQKCWQKPCQSWWKASSLKSPCAGMKRACRSHVRSAGMWRCLAIW